MGVQIAAIELWMFLRSPPRLTAMRALKGRGFRRQAGVTIGINMTRVRWSIVRHRCPATSYALETFYSLPSIAGRFPILGGRHRAQWLLYNMFMRRGAATEQIDPIAVPTPAADTSPMPPIMARQT